MPGEIRLPELGENIHGGQVVKLLVAVGDAVEKDQILLELETDKAVIEVPSPAAGTVAELLVQEGQNANVGDVVVRLGEADAAAAEDDPAPADPAEPAAEVARSGETRKAEHPEAEAPPEPETKTAPPADAPDPAKTDRPAPAQQATVDDARTAPEPDPDEAADEATRKPVPAAPSVRRLARELGIEITEVPPNPDTGRIGEAEVKQWVRDQIRHGGGGGRPSGPIRRPMDNVRKATARQMAKSWTEIPHVTHDELADITELERQRKHLAPQFEADGDKLTMTVLLVKALAAALLEFPKFRSSIDMEREVILEHPETHIGIAVDTERGLLVPVVRDPERKSLGELAREIQELAEKARERKLGPEALRGARMSLTNLGGIGGRRFSPLVNPPEVAVLGVSRASQQPVWRNDRFEPRLLLPLSLSYDHRLVDGADAARFARWLVEALENPLTILAGDSR